MKKSIFVVFMVLLIFNDAKSQLQMDADGEVGIGPFWGGTPRRLLDVNGYACFSCYPASAGFYFEADGTRPIILPQWDGHLRLGNSSSALYWIYSRYISTLNGDVYSYSDKSIKENIQPYSGALQKIIDLNTVSFDYKEEIFENVKVEEDKQEFI